MAPRYEPMQQTNRNEFEDAVGVYFISSLSFRTTVTNVMNSLHQYHYSSPIKWRFMFDSDQDNNHRWRSRPPIQYIILSTFNI